MPGYIPPEILKEFSKNNGLIQSVLAASDGKRLHVVTWGKTARDSAIAAGIGNEIKRDFLDWTEDLCETMSPRMKAAIEACENLVKFVKDLSANESSDYLDKAISLAKKATTEQ